MIFSRSGISVKPCTIWIALSLVINRRKSASLKCQISLCTSTSHTIHIYHVPVFFSWKECSRLVGFWFLLIIFFIFFFPKTILGLSFWGICSACFPSVAHAFEGHEDKPKWFSVINPSACWLTVAQPQQSSDCCPAPRAQPDRHSHTTTLPRRK